MENISKAATPVKLISWLCPWCGIKAQAWEEGPNIFHYQHCARCRNGYAWSRMPSGQVKTFIAVHWNELKKRFEVGL